jgi:hypothetical protein
VRNFFRAFYRALRLPQAKKIQQFSLRENVGEMGKERVTAHQ